MKLDIKQLKIKTILKQINDINIELMIFFEEYPIEL